MQRVAAAETVSRNPRELEPPRRLQKAPASSFTSNCKPYKRNKGSLPFRDEFKLKRAAVFAK